MTDRTLRLRKAAYYECEEWTAHVAEDDDTIRITWKGQPFNLPGGTEGWERDVLEPLLIAASAALRASLLETKEEG